MNKIDEDVMKKANQVVMDWWSSLDGYNTLGWSAPVDLHRHIAKAIMDERRLNADSRHSVDK